MSSISRTTAGGIDFEQLCRGAVRENYSANPANLAGQTEVEAIKQKLIAQLESTVRELELHSDRTIAKIYIGKTFIQRRKKGGGRGYQNLNPLKHHTWKKNGISSRWHVHKHEDYGRDGLVVLGAITKQTMPERCRDRVHQEDFALAMEQKLLHHYLLSHPDPRVVNESFTAGQATKDKCYAYAVYMAFRYEGESSPSTMCQYSEPGPSHTSPSPTNSPLPTRRSSSVQQRKEGKKGKSSVSQTQPTLLTQYAISSTAAQQQATGRGGARVQQASQMPGIPSRSSPATRHRKPPQTSESTNLGPKNTQPEESQQSTHSSRRRPIRFQTPKRQRGATRSSNEQQATGRGARIQPVPGEATNPGPRNTQPEEAQQSTRPSRRRSVRFDLLIQRKATRSHSIVIDLTDET